ncbi:RxLR effector protein [Phytophthora megakarya]|uniref:RxLR effector protein n=1 Tax=Phytophthora megakarya TaxID=4795 RepID=A0A225WLI7_9STRA|nr:RxLR effector protein [Phytophthora megakarya]
MRVYLPIVLTAAALLASTDALYSGQVSATKHNIAESNDIPNKRFLRKREMLNEDAEERGWNEFAAKLKRLGKYNVWIFTNKDMDWIKANHPDLVGGYTKFWENRMVRGGKYN